MPGIDLFSPGQVGELSIANRILMAPMTRNRATFEGVPTQMAVEYYTQRASAGLIITEGTSPSAAGLGYVRTPAIETRAQVAAWKSIVEAVHAKGGRIYLQLMHVGRVSQIANRVLQEPPVAPSAIRVSGQIFTDAGMQDFSMPRALGSGEIPAVIAEYAQATRHALEAGFDGVQLHAASGYLPMQFLSSGSNRRTDAYGGSLTNRLRFVIETLEAMIEAAGSPSRISLKISPAMPFNDIQDDDPVATYSALVSAASPLQLAFLHVLRSDPLPNIFEILRPLYPGTFAAVGGFTHESGNQALASGIADLVVLGKPFISNPDLPYRFRVGAPLAPWDPSTFYSGGAKGYIDYPSLADGVA
ncbi:MAG TPA: alkene reductase [Steroidobacteraceae bacterium]|jgi:N-ethylmaleimide reductase|nr:alkene reductase [Steroidobacteraceae bacterium]